VVWLFQRGAGWSFIGGEAVFVVAVHGRAHDVPAAAGSRVHGYRASGSSVRGVRGVRGRAEVHVVLNCVARRGEGGPIWPATPRMPRRCIGAESGVMAMGEARAALPCVQGLEDGAARAQGGPGRLRGARAGRGDTATSRRGEGRGRR